MIEALNYGTAGLIQEISIHCYCKRNFIW